MNRLLRVESLEKHFPIFGGVLHRRVATVRAVDGVTLELDRAETLGLVGESGCGKSTIGKTLLRLIEPTSGKVFFEDREITHMPKEEIRSLRREMQIIFQDPFESLNARHTVGKILEEPFVIHRIGTQEQRRDWGRELLEKVGLSESAADRFPHEFSGGQRQRIGIARAIALKPKLIVCDEPVSALDVSIQSQILNLLLTLQREMELGLLFIAHDLAVVKHVSDRIAVMYLGKIVEVAPAQTLYEQPAHPYTRALISAIPIPDPNASSERQILEGDVPSPRNPPSGCAFRTRCPHATEECAMSQPRLIQLPRTGGRVDSPPVEHLVACHYAGEL